MKYPVIKKRCRNQHHPTDADMCGDCVRAYEKLCEDFERKYEEVEIKELCPQCYGAMFFSGKYGQTACEFPCDKGYIEIKKWRHKKQ